MAHSDARRTQVENNLTSFFAPPLPEPRLYTLSERMAEYHVPGVSVAVIQGDQIEWAKGYGVRRSGDSGAVDTETLFQAGSISKPVAALAILRLAEAHQLDLDADVNNYLKTWRVPAVDGWQPTITLRHLLSHTGGTTVSGFMGYRHDQPLPSLVQILDGLEPANSDPIRVDTLPGTHFRYSGGGTTIAQQLASDVGGKPFQELARELVFEPLGMRHSTYQQPLPASYHHNAAAGHYHTETPVEGGWYTMPELAAAGLWTTPSDIALFALALRRAYNGGDGIISQQIARWMLTPVLEVEAENLSLGLGVFMRRPTPETAFFGHGGDNVGYKNNFKLYFDGSDRGAVVMTNGGQGLIEEILRSIAKVYDWPDYVPPAPESTASSSANLAGYAATYRSKNGFAFIVAVSGDHLTLQPTGQAVLELRPLSATTFLVYPLQTTVTFVREEDGRVSSLNLEQNGEKISAERLAM